MKKFALLAAAALYATPAFSTVLAPGASGVTPDPFNLATQGTLLASLSVPASALTFTGTMTSAVYRNTSGTLDFYYQVTRTGSGTSGDEAIQRFTSSSFAGFSVDAFFEALATGPFVAMNNGAGDAATDARNVSGGILTVDFGANPLDGTENSGVYIFRTNATDFTTGTFGILDGSAAQGPTFAPTLLPEPGTWMTMLAGFGVLGMALRFRRRRKVALA